MDRQQLKQMMKDRIKDGWFVTTTNHKVIFYNPKTNYRTVRFYSGSPMTLAFNQNKEVIVVE